MDYQEKLVWGQFLPTLVICGVYVEAIAKNGSGAHLEWMFWTLVVLAGVQVVYSILVAVIAKKEPRDERDRLIEYKAFKVSYLVLMAMSFVWVSAWAMHVLPVEQVTGAEAVLGAWFGVETIRTGTVLLLHRMDAVSA